MQAALELKAAQRKPAELAGPLLPYLARAKGRTGQGAGGRPFRCQTPTVWTADRQETSHPRADQVILLPWERCTQVFLLVRRQLV